MKRVVVIDALNMFIRNYIVNPMISTNGNPIGGAVGFLNSVKKLMRESKPDQIVPLQIAEFAKKTPDAIAIYYEDKEITYRELIDRSKETLIKEKEEVAQKLKELGVEESLISLKGMTQGMLVILGQKNIKKLNDFADLSSDELIGGFDEVKGKKIRIEGYLEEFSLSRKEADQLIMSAREIVYK